MKAVWRRYPINVKDVQQAIRPERHLAYTTVMTVLHRLYLKGFLDRKLQNKAHYYEPKVDFSDVRDAAVSGIIRHFFRGSRVEFLQFLENGVLLNNDRILRKAILIPYGKKGVKGIQQNDPGIDITAQL